MIETREITYPEDYQDITVENDDILMSDDEAQID